MVCSGESHSGHLRDAHTLKVRQGGSPMPSRYHERIHSEHFQLLPEPADATWQDQLKADEDLRKRLEKLHRGVEPPPPRTAEPPLVEAQDPQVDMSEYKRVHQLEGQVDECTLQ